MRCLLIPFLAAAAWLALAPPSHGQAPKARAYKASKTDILCDNLMIAIQEHPDNLVMRLEDALVINEAGAAEIVTAAITAVNANPKLVDQIVKTALHVAPNRARSILYSVNHFTPRAPAAMLAEEIRKAELPAGYAAKVGMVEEVRRAEKPDAAGAAPVEEVRKALVVGPRSDSGVTAASNAVVVMDTAAAVGGTPVVEEIRKAEPVPRSLFSDAKEPVVGKKPIPTRQDGGKRN